jgi:hypothetical protein
MLRSEKYEEVSAQARPTSRREFAHLLLDDWGSMPEPPFGMINHAGHCFGW